MLVLFCPGQQLIFFLWTHTKHCFTDDLTTGPVVLFMQQTSPPAVASTKLRDAACGECLACARSTTDGCFTVGPVRPAARFSPLRAASSVYLRQTLHPWRLEVRAGGRDGAGAGAGGEGALSLNCTAVITVGAFNPAKLKSEAGEWSVHSRKCQWRKVGRSG